MKPAWIAAQVFCLVFSLGWPWRFWSAYLAYSVSLSLFYAPLTDRWGHRFEWCLIVALALRFAAVMEALHLQTARFRYWARTIAGCWMIALFVVFLVWNVYPWEKGDPYRDFIQARRYVHLWLAMAAATELLFFFCAGAWRRLESSAHTVLVCLMVWNHALVGVLSMRGRWEMPAWVSTAWWSMLIELLLLVAWAVRYRPAFGGWRERLPSSR